MKNIWLFALAGVVAVGGVAMLNPGLYDRLLATVGKGAFDKFGYNDTARIFNGTGASWCLARGSAADCMGIYSPDKLVMKWTADWDRGNDENWANAPYTGAWLSNEWNGKKGGGSGEVWHYKIIWVGPELETSQYWQPGGYPIWGQFEVVMDQGVVVDPETGPSHIWGTKAMPNGYGVNKNK